MIDRRTRLRFRSGQALLVSFLALGCGGANNEHPAAADDRGGVVEPSSASERRVLELLDTLPAGKSHRIGSHAVVAERPYFSASGRICRGLMFTGEKDRSEQRLACKEEGKWFYVPNIVMAPAGAGE
jgi:hypothetical protein